MPQNLASAVEPTPSTLGIVGDTLYATSSTGWKWVNVYGATSYRVRRGTTGDFMLTPPAPFASPSSNGWTDTDVPPADTCYYYDLRAHDGSTESSN